MDEKYINGETRKIKVVRAQAYAEAVGAAADVVSKMIVEIIDASKEIAGSGDNFPEPYEMPDAVAKQVMLKIMEIVLATSSGLDASKNQQMRMYYQVVEQAMPEITNKHYGISINYGESADQEVVIKVHSISEMPKDIH